MGLDGRRASKRRSAAHRQVTRSSDNAPRWEDAHENEGQRQELAKTPRN